TVVYRPTVTAGSVAVCFERVDAADEVEAWIRRFVDATGYSGFAGFDFIVDARGDVHALECNPRVTSGIHFIETDALAAAVTNGDPPPLKAVTELTEAYSCYTAVLAAVTRPAECRRRWRALRRATDVTWSRADPWPFLTMSANTLPLMLRALRQRRSVAEVALLDLAWHPEQVQ
ncbi:MAG: hypothetical protein AAFX58_03130, partial [Pseudomonadota bacterium]